MRTVASVGAQFKRVRRMQGDPSLLNRSRLSRRRTLSGWGRVRSRPWTKLETWSWGNGIENAL